MNRQGTFALHFICTVASHDLGVSTWERSTLCLVFDGMSWVHGRSTPCLVFDDGLSTLDYV